jgi:hypothetical protein
MASDQSMPPDLDTWTQVGYNPDRHSYMYDRETGDPVSSGSEAVQIGNTIFVKDPEFGRKKDFKYSLEDEPLDTASENLNKTPNEPTSIQQEEPRPARALPKSRFYVSSDERGGDFAGAITEAARLHKKGAAVEVKSPEFYSDPENHLYFSEDGLAGAVVKPDGDLVSVFKHPDSTAKMRDILTDASQEATKLDGFDIDNFLPNYYSRFGFRPVARVTFNDDFAPPKWNFEENGRPDNVFMVRDPENKLGLPEYDAYSEVRDSVPLVSYEEALKLQQDAVDKVASEKPKGAVLASEKPSMSGQSNVLSPSATDTVTMKPFKYSVEDEPKAGSKKAVRTPNEAVRKLSDDYNAQMGLGPIDHGHYVNFDEATARKIAKAYDAMPEIDRSPETVKAYEALAKEVNDQWDFAVENLGMNFEPWTEDGQPYANSREMMEDVRNNNHLYFFRGGGKHEFMSQVDPETGLTSIDKLRAIHDLYGHAAEDYQFGPRGEENAWLKHSQMFTPEAQRALSVGTRGQNSWVNFGDQNYENGVNKNIPAKDRPYAPQKMALLPEELTDWRSALGQSEPDRSSVLAKQPIRESVTDDPVDVADLPKNLRGDSEGFIPTYITKQNALPTVVVGKNKTVEVPVIDFGQYADRVFKAKGVSELTGKEITLAEAHVPVIQKYYAGLSPETYREKDVRAAADMVANDMSNNLLFLHDLALDTFGPEVVKRMSKWYDGANVISKMFADKYVVSVEQSAAILATLSPQKHWFANVSLAENVMDVMRNHQDTVFDAAVEKAARASIKNSVGTTSSKRELYTAIRAISGKKLSDLSDLKEQTIFTRFLSQGIHPKLAYIVTPEGQLTPGSSVAVAWSGASITSNAVSAFLDGSVDNLTVALGGGHKVRNFNGNIIDPMSPFFYTSDTHNVAASLLIPVGGTDFEVSHNFGGNPGVGEGPKLPVIGTTVTGLQGTYPLYLEAGRRAAQQRNVLPRQMQSITWEMIRIMFTDDMKTPAFMDSVKRVHDQVRSGGLGIDSARQNIIELSGGRDAIKARPPEWLNK